MVTIKWERSVALFHSTRFCLNKQDHLTERTMLTRNIGYRRNEIFREYKFVTAESFPLRPPASVEEDKHIHQGTAVICLPPLTPIPISDMYLVPRRPITGCSFKARHDIFLKICPLHVHRTALSVFGSWYKLKNTAIYVTEKSKQMWLLHDQCSVFFKSNARWWW